MSLVQKFGLFLGVFLAILESLDAADQCRVLQFVEMYEGQAFNKDIFGKTSVVSQDQCEIACFVEGACKSYNLGPPDADGKHYCYLSSTDHISHPTYLAPEPGFIYRPSKSPCSIRCHENQTCFLISSNGNYECLCTNPGFTGAKCTTDLDECSAGTHDCAADANCTNTEGSYVCTCQTGYEGDGKTCRDKDECFSGEHECHMTATCVNIPGGFECTCSEEQVQDGNECFGFPFHWSFNGTDRLIRLHGAANYVEEHGRKVLCLNGAAGTFAQTNAIPIRNTDLTIGMWIKISSPASNPRFLYSDWSHPYQFQLSLITSGEPCFSARRDVAVVSDLFYICANSGYIVPIGVWRHVTLTWNRSAQNAKVYINRNQVRVKTFSESPPLDFKKTEHPYFDIGRKADTEDIVNGCFSDLWIYNRSLDGDEIEEKLFLTNLLKNLSEIIHP